MQEVSNFLSNPIVFALAVAAGGIVKEAVVALLRGLVGLWKKKAAKTETELDDKTAEAASVAIEALARGDLKVWFEFLAQAGRAKSLGGPSGAPVGVSLLKK